MGENKMKLNIFSQWTYREITNGFVVIENLHINGPNEYFVDNELDAVNLIVKSAQDQYKKVLGERHAHLKVVDPTIDCFDPRREV